MNVRKAIVEAFGLVREELMPDREGLSYAHLRRMVETVTAGDMPYGKECRWLGWFEAAVVVAGSASLEDMKRVNKANNDDPPGRREEIPEMDVATAMRRSFALADPAMMSGAGELSYAHLEYMTVAVEAGTTSYGKRCRWLGWLQCAVVAAGCATLEDMKRINAAAFPAA